MAKPLVLVTGGAGFIGSHTTVEMLGAGYDAVIVDNLSNSTYECVRRVEEITEKKIPFYEVDLCDKEALRGVFKKHQFTHVMHFAGLKAVGESCDIPLLYYQNNLIGTMNLVEVMKENKIFNLVFSSSATVYGIPQYLPLDEDHPIGGCTNPYGTTKHFTEVILSDLCKAEKEWNIVLLRYFNPTGAHKSGRIGEDPQGPPNNLMPYVAQVAVGRRPHLNVFGNDYDTPDGTGVRDFIHVVDLALGHVAALKRLEAKCGLRAYNLGTGKGYSVLEMLTAFSKACGRKLEHKLCPRREGDVGSCYANPDLALKEMGWKAEKGLQDMCDDLWRWQSNNPYGFSGKDVENGH